MKGPWQAEIATIDTLGTPPPGALSSTQSGGARYLDTIAGGKEVVEEQSVAVDREQCQQPRGTQQQEDSEGGAQA